MKRFVETTSNICPLKENVFRFFRCKLNKTKYIILGMDPYPSTYEENGVKKPVATGRAFEVANIDKWTDKYKQISLSNIFKALCFYKFNKLYSIFELRDLEKNNKINFINIHNWFDTMEERGVIFLNATLTTISGKSGVHEKEWSEFMNELILFINNNSKINWLIWGNVAYNRVKNIVSEDKIIYSCHPASRVKNDFISNNCFKKANKIEWF
jgi:uracil-DNA glycosylase